MGFEEMCFESDPCFLDWTKMIPGLDGLLEFSYIVKNVVCLGDYLRVRKGTALHVPVLEKVFNLIENIFDWSYRVIMHICNFFFEISQMTW